MSSSAVCTLYEGHYHFGVGALANSLYAAGFRGTLWVGFRGALPPWLPADAATAAEPTFAPAAGLELRFIRLNTSTHLTNFKPDFLLDVAARAPNAQHLLYLDPDIVVRAPWSFFEDWVDAGVAAVEDINSPLDDFHPRRAAWRRYFAPHRLTLRTRSPLYVNGGFTGLHRRDLAFLTLWQNVQQLMAPAVGGLSAANISGGQMQFGQADPTFCFNKTDQDALNVTLMAWDGPISLMGGDAMDFRPGGYVMSHALGGIKPWARSYLMDLVRGYPPRLADKFFWEHAYSPIALYASRHIKLKQVVIKVSSFVGRLYRRGS